MTASKTFRLDELPPTISVEEAAALLGISRGLAYRAAASGALPALRLGKRLRVSTTALRRVLADGYTGASGLRSREPEEPDQWTR
jgi:excisionase family DNA binding protein